jgi:hypothetical protein
MALLNDTFIWLSQKLYPNGRAFWMAPPKADETGGIFYRLHRAISNQQAAAYNFLRGIQNAQLPDNPGFTIDDAHAWYRRLGIYDSGTVPFDDMKARIRQAMSFPQVPLNKQNYNFITQQLQDAGFNVKVWENRFDDGAGGWETRTPDEVLGTPAGEAYLDDFELDELDLDSTYSIDNISILANYLEDAAEEDINITNWRSTFYVAAPDEVNIFAAIPESRHIEFRQLLLKLKPAHTIGILFVIYT